MHGNKTLKNGVSLSHARNVLKILQVQFKKKYLRKLNQTYNRYVRNYKEQDYAKFSRTEIIFTNLNNFVIRARKNATSRSMAEGFFIFFTDLLYRY